MHAGFRMHESSQRVFFSRGLNLYLCVTRSPKRPKAMVPLILLAGACSPFVSHVFVSGPWLSLRVFFPGRLPVLHWYCCPPHTHTHTPISMSECVAAWVGRRRLFGLPGERGTEPPRSWPSKECWGVQKTRGGVCGRNLPELLNHPSVSGKMAAGKRSRQSTMVMSQFPHYSLTLERLQYFLHYKAQVKAFMFFKKYRAPCKRIHCLLMSTWFWEVDDACCQQGWV